MPKVCSIPHFLGEYVCQIEFTSNVFDSNVLSWTHSWTAFSQSWMWWAALEGILGDHHTHTLASLSLYRTAGAFISVKFTLEADKELLQRFLKLTTFGEVALVAWISASQELSSVHSWQLPSQPRGLTFLKSMPPLILWNLKRGRRVPSATTLPIWDPQQASL